MICASARGLFLQKSEKIHAKTIPKPLSPFTFRLYFVLLYRNLENYVL